MHRPEREQDTAGTNMTENKTPTTFLKKTEQSDYHSDTKKVLSFSIERILAIDSKQQSSDVLCSAETAPKTTQPRVESVTNLPWLSYTRYRPPKLPSKYNYTIQYI